MLGRLFYQFKRRKWESPPQLTLEFKAVVEPDGDGYYAYAPAFEGLHVFGDTKEEALRYVGEAVVLNLYSLAKHDDPLPIGPYFMVNRPSEPEVPTGGTLEDVKVSWPTIPLMSGVN